MATPAEERAAVQAIRRQNVERAKKAKEGNWFLDEEGNPVIDPWTAIQAGLATIPFAATLGLTEIAKEVEKTPEREKSDLRKIGESFLPQKPEEIRVAEKRRQISKKEAEKFREGTFFYGMRLLSAPTSAAVGAVESIVKGEPIGETVAKRIREGEGLAGGGGQIGKAVDESLGTGGWGETIGWGIGLVGEFFVPILPGKATGVKAAAGALQTLAPGSKVAAKTVKTLAPRSAAAQLYRAADQLERVAGSAAAGKVVAASDLKMPGVLINDVGRAVLEDIGLGFVMPPPNVRGLVAMNAAKRIVSQLDNVPANQIDNVLSEMKVSPKSSLGEMIKAYKATGSVNDVELWKGTVVPVVGMGPGAQAAKKSLRERILNELTLEQRAAASQTLIQTQIARKAFDQMAGLDLPNYVQLTDDVWVPASAVPKVTKEVKDEIARITRAGADSKLAARLESKQGIDAIIRQKVDELVPDRLTRSGVITRTEAILLRNKVISPEDIKADRLTQVQGRADRLATDIESGTKEIREMKLATRPGQIPSSRAYQAVSDTFTMVADDFLNEPGLKIYRGKYGAVATRLIDEITRGISSIDENFKVAVRKKLRAGSSNFTAVVSTFYDEAVASFWLKKQADVTSPKMAKSARPTLDEVKRGYTLTNDDKREIARNFLFRFLSIQFGYHDDIVETVLTPSGAIGKTTSMPQRKQAIETLLQTNEDAIRAVEAFAENNLLEGYKILARLNNIDEVKITVDVVGAGKSEDMIVRSVLGRTTDVNKQLALSHTYSAIINNLQRNMMDITEDIVRGIRGQSDEIPETLAISNNTQIIENAAQPPNPAVVKKQNSSVPGGESMVEFVKVFRDFYGDEASDILSATKTVRDFKTMVENTSDITRLEALMFSPFARPFVKRAMEITGYTSESSKVLKVIDDLNSGNLSYDKIGNIRKGGVWSVIDGMMSHTKTGILSGFILPNLRYHGVNYLTAPSVLIQTLGFGGTIRTFDPKVVMGTQRVIQSITSGQVLSRFTPLKDTDDFVVVVDQFGRKYTVNDIATMVLDNNVLQSQAKIEVQQQIASELVSWTRNNWLKGAGTEGKNVLSRFIRAYLPTTFGRGQNIWSEMATITDLRWRTGILIDSLRQGLPPLEASARAREALFDYGSITQIERDYITKFIWFWSFRRANLINTFKLAVTQPQLIKGSTIATLSRPYEEMPGMEPEFVKTRTYLGLVTNPKNKKRWAAYGPSLPITEGVAELVDYASMLQGILTGIGTVGPGTTTQKLIESGLAQTNPIFSELVGTATETKIGFGEVRRYYGNVKSEWLWFLSQNPEMFQTFTALVPLKEVKKPNKDRPFYLGKQWKPADKNAENTLRLLEGLMLVAGVQRTINDYAKLSRAAFDLEQTPADPLLESRLLGTLATATGMVLVTPLDEKGLDVERKIEAEQKRREGK